MSCLPPYRDTKKMSDHEFDDWYKTIYKPHVEQQKMARKRFAEKYYKPKNKK